MPTTPAIAAHDLTKSYGDLLAVNQVSLRVEQGQIYALLGLNGAGKTTMIRMLLGMIRPTAATCRSWAPVRPATRPGSRWATW